MVQARRCVFGKDRTYINISFHRVQVDSDACVCESSFCHIDYTTIVILFNSWSMLKFTLSAGQHMYQYRFEPRVRLSLSIPQRRPSV